MILLNELHDNDGSKKNRIRVGRGIGSGKGKTCGRGEKGQKSRSGVAIKGFEGGQMPVFRRLPKRGFNNIFRTEYEVVNLFQLQQCVDDNKIVIGSIVDKSVLFELGLIRSSKNLVKLLGNGALENPLDIRLDAISKSASDVINKVGGKASSHA